MALLLLRLLLLSGGFPMTLLLLRLLLLPGGFPMALLLLLLLLLPVGSREVSWRGWLLLHSDALLA
jgi:hypothetical protein